VGCVNSVAHHKTFDLQARPGLRTPHRSRRCRTCAGLPAFAPLCSTNAPCTGRNRPRATGSASSGHCDESGDLFLQGSVEPAPHPLVLAGGRGSRSRARTTTSGRACVRCEAAAAVPVRLERDLRRGSSRAVSA
jgi:hypothetical protein